MNWNMLAIAAFLLFFVYDWNSIRWKNQIVQRFFGLGTGILAVSAVGSMIQQRRQSTWQTWQMILLAAVFCLAAVLLIYTLFFAIPFDETYVQESQSRKACTDKIYALCRHPGVLWLAVVLGICAVYKWNRATVQYALLVTLCNIGYVIYQDLLIFPETFENYREYQKHTPFLIPNRRSIQKCIKDYQNKGNHT